MTIRLTPNQILALPIEELELGVRAYNILKRMGIDTIGQFQNVSAQDLNRWTLENNPAPGLPSVRQIATAQAQVDAWTAVQYAPGSDGSCDGYVEGRAFNCHRCAFHFEQRATDDIQTVSPVAGGTAYNGRIS